VQRVVVVAREIIFLNGAALQTLKLGAALGAITFMGSGPSASGTRAHALFRFHAL